MKYHVAFWSLALLLAGCNPPAPVGSQVIGSGTGPKLSQGPGDSVILSFIESGTEADALVYYVIDRDGIGEKQQVVSGDDWFVNWADFPSVVALSDMRWAAHWLVHQPAGGYAYDVFASISGDAGKSWGPRFRLNNDNTPTEHGFVTLYPSGDRLAAVWLDGRMMAGGHDGHGEGGMTLRSGQFDSTGTATSEQVVDDLTCDCCQTDIAIAASGPVAVYRNRSEEEVRDIYLARFIDGQWQAGVPVHDDSWTIAGCPVNGPVVSADGERIAVTWFTAANGTPQVNTAWSLDSGKTFNAPAGLDADHPLGYVGSAMLGDGSIVASWACRSDDVGDNAGHALCYRKVDADRTLGPVRQIANSKLMSRMSVPQVALVGGSLLFAWTAENAGNSEIHLQAIPVSSL